jgi:hypothetical protein
MPVPMWQIVIPLLALAVLGYTIYRNVIPYPDSDQPAYWFPIVAGGWIALCVIVVVLAGGAAARVGRALTAEEGFMTDRATPGATTSETTHA